MGSRARGPACTVRRGGAGLAPRSGQVTARSGRTTPVPVTKIPNVGVPLALICVGTVGPMAEMHAPVAAFVWHAGRFRSRPPQPGSH
jgi:hypothetical protein